MCACFLATAVCLQDSSMNPEPAPKKRRIAYRYEYVPNDQIFPYDEEFDGPLPEVPQPEPLDDGVEESKDSEPIR